MRRMIKQIKAYLRLRKRVVLDKDKQYVWQLENASQEDIKVFKDMLSDVRYRRTSHIITNNKIKVYPATSIKHTFKYGEFNSRTQLLRRLNQAIKNDWDKITDIRKTPDLIIVERVQR